MAEHESRRVAVANGDGIGPEIVPAAVRVAKRALELVDAEHRIEWVEVDAGLPAIERTGLALPPESVSALEDSQAVVLGPVDHATYPRYPDGRRQNPSGEIRKHFDLFANVRPAKNVQGIRSVVSGTDLVIVRENTEGFYSDRNMFAGNGEFRPIEDVALSVGVFTRSAVERVVRYAFELAASRRGGLTVVHKANVLPETTGMYLAAARRFASEFPTVIVTDEHVDAMAALVVRRPETFDVIVTENLFGDILSDLTAQLTGSLGMAGSLNAGTDYAMAQAAHGSAPDIAGKNIANPSSLISSVAMLLHWLGERGDDAKLSAAAASMDAALEGALQGNPTGDLGGTATTTEFIDAVIEQLSAHRMNRAE